MLPHRPARCGACDAPAVVRFALCAPDERPAAALTRRPQYRCPACSPLGVPDFLAAVRVDSLDWLVVVDPAFTREALDPLCACGLPADHREPLSGEPRPCADETERIALPGVVRRRPPGVVRPLPLRRADDSDVVFSQRAAAAIADLIESDLRARGVGDEDQADDGDDRFTIACPRCRGGISPVRVHTCPDGVTPGARP
jgi:hypothetical protein